MTRGEAIAELERSIKTDFAIVRNKAIQMAIDALKAEPIVHCKDCAHRTENTSTWCRWYIYRNGNIDSLDDYKPDENDYCSMGEWKDEVTE